MQRISPVDEQSNGENTSDEKARNTMCAVVAEHSWHAAAV